ncbi:hypothetical protein J4399_02830 [Candidatus Woesearchaeota archaeon]|nr:hypothetical protein [Candidatus Woesearchaeota archaeon]HIH54704.1 hypothetical protein [Candidatus Woesearchaeota archaeon]HIJ01427.1 hypothetical protein [Candidatus Woesearchaeota archaeon]HIJ13995.1 hypothetical protein [Candidatus Woesearchaeota archaeon]
MIKKHKFCPKCGKTITKGIFCKNCSEPDFKFKDINIKICNSCNSYYHRNKWVKFRDINTVIKKVCADSIKAKVKIKKLSRIIHNKVSGHKAGIQTDLILEIIHKKVDYDIPSRLEVTLCNKCSLKYGQFFDSILQLRNCNDEILNFTRNEVKKHNKKGVFINKEVQLDKYSIKDIDLYLTNQSYAKTLADKIKKNFGGIIKKNAQHFSLNKQTTKVLYRLNILLTLPNYNKNDVIKHDNQLYKIISVGDRIKVENLKTKHKTSLMHNESYDILKPVIFQVIKRYPEYEVLDPTTYYQARLMNPTLKLEINQKIKVIIDGGEAWMV